MFWTLDRPFWEMSISSLPDFPSVFMHGINFVLIFIEACVSRLPINWNGFGWAMAYGLLYSFWSYLHFLLGIGTGDPCASYPLEECPIYKPLDWHKPAQTGVLLATILLLATPLAYAVFWSVGRIRDSCAKEANAPPQSLAEQRMESSIDMRSFHSTVLRYSAGP